MRRRARLILPQPRLGCITRGLLVWMGHGGPKREVGGVMNRLAVSIACIALAGCSSLTPNDSLSTGSTGYPIKLESDPPGADARTSIGPGCQTPCTVSVPARSDFTVTFALAGRQTQTIPVQLQASGNETATVQFVPNPVFAAL